MTPVPSEKDWPQRARPENSVVLTKRQPASSWGRLGITSIRSHPTQVLLTLCGGRKSEVAWNGTVEIWGSAEGDQTHPESAELDHKLFVRGTAAEEDGASARRRRLIPV